MDAGSLHLRLDPLAFGLHSVNVFNLTGRSHACHVSGRILMRVLDAIADILNKKSSVQMVADDPQKSAELLLLIRTMFADGEMNEQEISAFQSLCSTVFEIPAEDVPDVIRYLKDFGYETSSEQSAAIFSDMPDERKKELLSRLMTMAMADAKFHEGERVMITRVAKVLGFAEEDVTALLRALT